MPHNRQIVIGICAISWSLLSFQILTELFLRFSDPDLPSGPAWNWLSRAAAIIQDLQPGLMGAAALILFVLAAASTAELLVTKWGVQEESNDPT